MALIGKNCGGSGASGLTLWDCHGWWAHSPRWSGYKYMSVLSTITHVHTHTNIFLIGSWQAGRLFLITWLIVTASDDIKWPNMEDSTFTFTYISTRKDKITKCKDSKTQDAESLTLDQNGAAWRELRWSNQSSRKQKQPGLSSGSLLMRWVPAI